MSGAENGYSTFLENPHICLGRGIAPHLLVHGRSDEQGRGCCQGGGGQQVVCPAHGQAGQGVSGCGCNQKGVSPAGQFDMTHAHLSCLIEQVGMNRVAG